MVEQGRRGNEAAAAPMDVETEARQQAPPAEEASSRLDGGGADSPVLKPRAGPAAFATEDIDGYLMSMLRHRSKRGKHTHAAGAAASGRTHQSDSALATTTLLGPPTSPRTVASWHGPGVKPTATGATSSGNAFGGVLPPSTSEECGGEGAAAGPGGAVVAESPPRTHSWQHKHGHRRGSGGGSGGGAPPITRRHSSSKRSSSSGALAGIQEEPLPPPSAALAAPAMASTRGHHPAEANTSDRSMGSAGGAPARILGGSDDDMSDGSNGDSAARRKRAAADSATEDPLPQPLPVLSPTVDHLPEQQHQQPGATVSLMGPPPPRPPQALHMHVAPVSVAAPATKLPDWPPLSLQQALSTASGLPLQLPPAFLPSVTTLATSAGAAAPLAATHLLAHRTHRHGLELASPSLPPHPPSASQPLAHAPPLPAEAAAAPEHLLWLPYAQRWPGHSGPPPLGAGAAQRALSPSVPGLPLAAVAAMAVPVAAAAAAAVMHRNPAQHPPSMLATLPPVGPRVSFPGPEPAAPADASMTTAAAQLVWCEGDQPSASGEEAAEPVDAEHPRMDDPAAAAAVAAALGLAQHLDPATDLQQQIEAGLHQQIEAGLQQQIEALQQSVEALQQGQAALQAAEQARQARETPMGSGAGSVPQGSCPSGPPLAVAAVATVVAAAGPPPAAPQDDGEGNELSDMEAHKHDAAVPPPLGDDGVVVGTPLPAAGSGGDVSGGRQGSGQGSGQGSRQGSGGNGSGGNGSGSGSGRQSSDRGGSGGQASGAQGDEAAGVERGSGMAEPMDVEVMPTNALQAGLLLAQLAPTQHLQQGSSSGGNNGSNGNGSNGNGSNGNGSGGNGSGGNGNGSGGAATNTSRSTATHLAASNGATNSVLQQLPQQGVQTQQPGSSATLTPAGSCPAPPADPPASAAATVLMPPPSQAPSAFHTATRLTPGSSLGEARSTAACDLPMPPQGLAAGPQTSGAQQAAQWPTGRSAWPGGVVAAQHAAAAAVLQQQQGAARLWLPQANQAGQTLLQQLPTNAAAANGPSAMRQLYQAMAGWQQQQQSQQQQQQQQQQQLPQQQPQQQQAAPQQQHHKAPDLVAVPDAEGLLPTAPTRDAQQSPLAEAGARPTAPITKAGPLLPQRQQQQQQQSLAAQAPLPVQPPALQQPVAAVQQPRVTLATAVGHAGRGTAPAQDWQPAPGGGGGTGGGVALDGLTGGQWQFQHTWDAAAGWPTAAGAAQFQQALVQAQQMQQQLANGVAAATWGRSGSSGAINTTAPWGLWAAANGAAQPHTAHQLHAAAAAGQAHAHALPYMQQVQQLQAQAQQMAAAAAAMPWQTGQLASGWPSMAAAAAMGSSWANNPWLTQQYQQQLGQQQLGQQQLGQQQLGQQQQQQLLQQLSMQQQAQAAAAVGNVGGSGGAASPWGLAGQLPSFPAFNWGQYWQCLAQALQQPPSSAAMAGAALGFNLFRQAMAEWNNRTPSPTGTAASQESAKESPRIGSGGGYHGHEALDDAAGDGDLEMLAPDGDMSGELGPLDGSRAMAMDELRGSGGSSEEDGASSRRKPAAAAAVAAAAVPPPLSAHAMGV